MNRTFGRTLLALGFAAVCASAQPTPPFTMRIQTRGVVEAPADGGTLQMPSEGIGLPVAATLTIGYTGTAANTTVSLNSVTFSGSTDFSFSGTGNWPLQLTNLSNTTSVGLQFLPTSSRAQTARVVFNYSQTVTVNNVSTTTNGTLTLNLSGTAPEFVYSYIPQPNGNSTILNNGDTVTYPQTDVLATTSTVFVLTNRGSGAGTVNGIIYSGDEDFVLGSVPFPPTTVEPNRDLRFQVLFTPSDLPAVTGTVRVNFVAGRTLSFQVAGTGRSALYEYEVIQSNRATPLAVDGLITLADVAVNEKSQAIVRVRNVGNADGIIRTIGVTGATFALSEVPFVPATIVPGGALTMTVNFAPTQPGRTLGKLRIGVDSFDLAGTGLGATLTYAYVSGSSTFTLQAGNAVVFTPVAVGQTSTVRVTVSNTGTASTAINSISAGGANANIFTLSNVPAVPANIGAGESIGFNVTFAPLAVGTVTGTLRIYNQTYTLTGIGNAPVALPTYAFQGTTGNVDPSQQPSVGLTLNANYPLDVTGTLTLAFNSDVFSNDPAVQFATGGRTIAFTIPANTRQAVFANRATTVRLQSGTVAGAIVLTPSFATSTGIDVTPVNPTPLTLTVPQQGPVLQNVVVSAKTANTITLLVTGYSSSRSITGMDFQFTPTPEETVGTSRVTLNVESSFNAWYGSTASQAFGSMFTVTIPFTLTGDLKKVTTLADTVRSISVTLTNRLGTSAARSVDIR